MRATHLMPLFDKLLLPFIAMKIKGLVGVPQDYGLPRPNHKFGDTHPTISSEIHIRMGSGDVKPKPNITELKGDKVCFADGSEVAADVIIYATGYNIRFPFFEDQLIKAENNDIALYQRIVDPRFNNLFFIGLVQPLCAMMPIAEEQSKWVAAYLRGENHWPTAAAMDSERLRVHMETKEKFTHSARHTIEIDCPKYTYELWQNLKEGKKRAQQNHFALPLMPQAQKYAAAAKEGAAA